MLLLLALACTQIPKTPRDPQVEGRALLQASVEAHGGLQAFEEVGDLSMRVEDVWHAQRIAPEQPGDPRLVYNPSLGKGVATFKESDAVWGHDSMKPWVMEGGVEVPVERPLFVPTYGYFLSLPFKFLDPGVNSESLGPVDWQGQSVDQVLVWFDVGVGSASDRYLLYLDPETHRLLGMRFTFMDMGRMPQLEARMTFQEVGDLWLPLELDIFLMRPVQTPMHTLRFEELVRVQDFERGKYEAPGSD